MTDYNNVYFINNRLPKSLIDKITKGKLEKNSMISVCLVNSNVFVSCVDDVFTRCKFYNVHLLLKHGRTLKCKFVKCNLFYEYPFNSKEQSQVWSDKKIYPNIFVDGKCLHSSEMKGIEGRRKFIQLTDKFAE